MYVDPRVAHARAKLQLNDRAIAPEAFDKDVSGAIWRSLGKVAGMNMSGRQMRRHLNASLVPALERLGMDVTVDTADGFVGVHAWASICDAENGLRALSYFFETGWNEIISGSWFAITPHAVARCLQRNGAIKISDIRAELLSAWVLAQSILHIGRELEWRQAFVPTPHGLFIGTLAEGEGLDMRTYIRPGLNGRASKWDAVFASLPPMPPVQTLRKESDLEPYGRQLLAWGEARKESPDRKFAFLSSPYEAGCDPLNEAWSVQRA